MYRALLPLLLSSLLLSLVPLDMSYGFRLDSEGARDVVLYLPFPSHDGEPAGRLMEGMEPGEAGISLVEFGGHRMLEVRIPEVSGSVTARTPYLRSRYLSEPSLEPVEGGSALVYASYEGQPLHLKLQFRCGRSYRILSLAHAESMTYTVEGDLENGWNRIPVREEAFAD